MTRQPAHRRRRDPWPGAQLAPRIPAPARESPWRRSWRADPAAARLADRHYNRQQPGTPQFVPPGRCLVLLAADHAAVWVTSWPEAAYVQHDWAGAWVNSLFRREDGPHLASDLIRWAVAHTRAEWPDVPDLGMVTFIDAGKVRPKRDPGRCYLRAGFRLAGRTRGGLLALQLLPADMPAALVVPSDQLTLTIPPPPCPRCGSDRDRCLCGPDELAAWLTRRERAAAMGRGELPADAPLDGA